MCTIRTRSTTHTTRRTLFAAYAAAQLIDDAREDHPVYFVLRAKRDVAVAKVFFSKAVKHQGQPPETSTLDGYAASARGRA